jgi:hypothetical protein
VSLTNVPRIGLMFMATTLLVSASCFGQSPTGRGLTGAGGLEVAGTYTHVLTDGSFGTPLGLNGWTASAAAPVLPLLEVTGEVGNYRKTGFSMYSFLAGPQIKVPIWRVQPFVRGLFGLSHFNGGNDFSVAAGGGLDIPWKYHLSIRAIQCDYYRIHATDMLRVGVGVTYSFSR